MTTRDRLFWEEQHENLTRERCRSALEALAALPVDEFDYRAKSDDHPIFGVNGHYIKLGHVRDARAALDALNGAHVPVGPKA
jgi:hypothetical protein